MLLLRIFETKQPALIRIGHRRTRRGICHAIQRASCTRNVDRLVDGLLYPQVCRLASQIANRSQIVGSHLLLNAEIPGLHHSWHHVVTDRRIKRCVRRKLCFGRIEHPRERIAARKITVGILKTARGASNGRIEGPRRRGGAAVQGIRATEVMRNPIRCSN